MVNWWRCAWQVYNAGVWRTPRRAQSVWCCGRCHGRVRFALPLAVWYALDMHVVWGGAWWRCVAVLPVGWGRHPRGVLTVLRWLSPRRFSECSTTVFSHAQTAVVCANCSVLLCTPTGGKTRLTEGCSFRKKIE